MRLFLLQVAVFFLLVGSVAAESAQSEYLVGEGDILKISVYDNPDLDTVIRIDADGSIQFPLVGQVDLSGLNVTGVAERIESLLEDGFLINPQVSVFIQEYRSKKVVVMGQVKNPGVFELSRPTRLLELISMAGGLREDAGDKLTINRNAFIAIDNQPVLRIDLQRLLQAGDSSLNVEILDGDNIFIPKASMVYIIGEIEKPGGYKYEDGATVLKVVSMAGGFAEFAAKKKVRIIRAVDGQEQRIERVSLQEPVYSGDLIEIPESLF